MKLLSCLLLSFSLLLLQNSRPFWLDLTNNSGHKIGQSNSATLCTPTKAEQKIDPESIDFDLLETSLLAAIEKQRPKLHNSNFKITKVLRKISVDLLSRYSYSNIKYAMRKNKLPTRKWKRIVAQGDFNGTYKTIAVATAPLYEYPKRAKVYHDQSDSEHPFYYMQRKKQIPLSTHTYETLVDYLLKNAAFSDFKKLFKSKGLIELGYAFRLEDRGDAKMPYLSLAIIGGGYRLERLRAE